MKVYERPRDIDFESFQSELFAALRGKERPARMSAKLKLSHNLWWRWESGQHKISWLQFVQVAADLELEFGDSVRRLLNYAGKVQDWAELVRFIVGRHDVKELSRLLEISPSTLRRWIQGKNEPSMIELFRLIHCCTDRFLDLAVTLTSPSKLSSIADNYQMKLFERRLQAECPWVAYIPRCTELADYEALTEHRPGFISEALGISLKEEEQGIRDLLKIGVLSWSKEGKGAKLIATSKYLNTDDPQAPWRLLAITSHWHRVQLEALEFQLEAAKAGRTPLAGRFGGYRAFATNRATLDKINELRLRFDRELLSLLSSDDNRGNHEFLMNFYFSMVDIREFVEQRDRLALSKGKS